MRRVARVTDRHKGICNHGMDCCPHHVEGPITQGSPDTFTNSHRQARHQDMVTHNCPHCGTGHIISSNQSVFINGRAIARIGDSVLYPGGSGAIVSGSDDTHSG